MKTELRVRGYSSRPNVAPGDTISFHLANADAGAVGCGLVRLVNGDVDPDGPGSRMERVDTELGRTLWLTDAFTQSGSFVTVSDPEGRIRPSAGFSLHLYLWSTRPGARRQGVFSRWDDTAGSGFALTLDETGLSLVTGDGTGRVDRVATGMPLCREVWYSVVVTFDPATGRASMSQRAVINRVNSVFGVVVPFDGSAHADGTVPTPVDVPVDLVIAGLGSRIDGMARVVDLYNGKLDSPRWWDRPLGADEVEQCHAGQDGSDPVAAWRLNSDSTVAGFGLGDTVDEPIGGLTGRCVNQPDRAMTGWNWLGDEHDFRHAPDQYGAMWFHEDSLDDCRWPETLRFTVPNDLPSGCYALELVEQDHPEPETFHVVFFVTAPRGAVTKGRALLLIPTFSYLAYSNSQVYQNAPAGQLANGHITVLEDLDLAMNSGVPQYGLSLYDYHSDGHGVQSSTWRRPQLGLQPAYQHEQGSTVWQFPADLHLVCWLTDQHFDFDVATDHDLHEQGALLFAQYSAVVTGTHPEYYSGEMVDAWEDYLAGGGRGMYLGGNGMYWVTSTVPGKDHIIEVRRGEQGDQAWRGRPGELHHSTTGEKGGLWRMRGRAPQKVWGTGYTSHTMAASTYYEFLPDAADPRLAWMLAGIDPKAPFGDFGLVHGGAAGLEVDRYDLSLGTPPHTRLVASSVGHGANAMLVPEELYFAHPAGNGEESPLVRADMTYFTTPAGGAMFASSSMSWAASLLADGGHNPVSRLTANVLRRFVDATPMDELVD